MAPVSRLRKPKRRARCAAMVLLPAPAGPSMAITGRAGAVCFCHAHAWFRSSRLVRFVSLRLVLRQFVTQASIANYLLRSFTRRRPCRRQHQIRQGFLPKANLRGAAALARPRRLVPWTPKDLEPKDLPSPESVGGTSWIFAPNGRLSWRGGHERLCGRLASCAAIRAGGMAWKRRHLRSALEPKRLGASGGLTNLTACTFAWGLPGRLKESPRLRERASGFAIG